ncbi:ADP-ribosylglycohydrolase [Deinococcus metalli]|uniref:ADP-ribosylglycohydrolase n=1 Tax=Deinococcus metalli TaxID=1141878 RepID=A0A7W8KAW2_9DEIO|nr:ADP-ribosylglycohydrolase family protein [Deinococcus metalli]MBB5374892.1 ADP-ribosylglycohydrolase [Deinococcus metalli]GHF32941.1 ADP-ribosylglycohydrolase [Deinococcus metalli]
MPDAALTTLLSLSAADALGAATEFKTPQAIHAHYGVIDTYQPGSVFGFAPGEATDDSQMVVATLLGYARSEGHPGVLAALRAWLAAGPPDVGSLTRSALDTGRSAPDRLDGGVRAWQDSGHRSAGNGGLMRIAAVWIAGVRGEALARESAVVTALTHADPRCVHASVFLTAFLDALARGAAYAGAAAAALDTMDRFDARGALLDAGVLGVESRGAFAAFTAQDRGARAQVRARVRAGLDGHVTSQSGFVLDTLEAAVAHARADDWLGGVQPAVLLGDDSDTVACVTGAILGARGIAVPGDLLPPLRLGHSWPGWDRAWPCAERYPALLRNARPA